MDWDVADFVVDARLLQLLLLQLLLPLANPTLLSKVRMLTGARISNKLTVSTFRHLLGNFQACTLKIKLPLLV